MAIDPSSAESDSTRVTLSRREALVAGAGAVGVLAGCAGGPNRSLPDRPTGAWTHRAHDRRNTGSADVSVPSRGTPAWDAGDAHVATPVLSAGTVYSVASEATALDARDGSLRWSTDLPGKADPAPALRGEALIVAAGDRLLALSRSTGVTVGREAVVVPGHDIPGADLPGIVALERADGAVRWNHPIEGFDVVVSTPAVLADGAVFYASNESVGIVALGDLPAPTE